MCLCGQRRLWSDYVDAQADLSLRWAHTSEGMFSHVEAETIKHAYRMFKFRAQMFETNDVVSLPYR